MNHYNITEEKLDQPCCIEAPDLWIFYCNMVGREPKANTKWTIEDVLKAIQKHGFECKSCGDN